MCDLQRVLHQANQKKVSVALALLMLVMVVLSLPSAPQLGRQGEFKFGMFLPGVHAARSHCSRLLAYF